MFVGVLDTPHLLNGNFLNDMLNSFNVTNKDHVDYYESDLLIGKVELVSTDNFEQVSAHWVMGHAVMWKGKNLKV